MYIPSRLRLVTSLAMVSTFAMLTAVMLALNTGCQSGQNAQQGLASTAQAVQLSAQQTADEQKAAGKDSTQAQKVADVAGTVFGVVSDPAMALGNLLVNHSTTGNIGLALIIARAFAPQLIGLLGKIGGSSTPPPAGKPATP